MRILTLNCNGLRSAVRKGVLTWAEAQQADVICLQETRIQDAQLTPEMHKLGMLEGVFHHAERPGYSGVSLHFRTPPDQLQHGFGWPEFDTEGRFLQADWGKLSIVSLYLPSGSSGEVRQDFKYAVLERLKSWFRERPGINKGRFNDMNKKFIGLACAAALISVPAVAAELRIGYMTTLSGGGAVLGKHQRAGFALGAAPGAPL